MTQRIIDELTSQTPIGELLRRHQDNVIELRSEAGELLGTPFLSERTDDIRYQELKQQLAADRGVLRERLSRPPRQGLTTPEFLERLQELGREA
ncbi:MAG: hypothetical protein AB7U20_15230 [Planctomycetaceae bacterium]